MKERSGELLQGEEGPTQQQIEFLSYSFFIMFFKWFKVHGSTSTSRYDSIVLPSKEFATTIPSFLPALQGFHIII